MTEREMGPLVPPQPPRTEPSPFKFSLDRSSHTDPVGKGSFMTRPVPTAAEQLAALRSSESHALHEKRFGHYSLKDKVPFKGGQ